MADSEQMIGALDARVTRRNDRRDFFKAAVGATVVGAGALAFAGQATAQAVTDADILNFALNLEYLEANFYAFAATGAAIDTKLTSGSGAVGAATGGRKVNFTDPVVAQYAKEIAADELAHVTFLRGQLASAVAGQPAIDLGVAADGAFDNFGRAAGLAELGKVFDPYASDENFLLAAFIFEDVGVTAYKGAASQIANRNILEATAGILGVEAYHAAIVRSTLYRKGIETPSSQLIEKAGEIAYHRDILDGIKTDIDIGIAPVTTPIGTASNISPVDANGVVYGRTTGQVLNIVYDTRIAASMGGFFPKGLNGTIKASVVN